MEEEKKWYCVGESGSAVGPFTATALREQCRGQERDAKKLLVWRVGLGSWVEFASVEELKQERDDASRAETFSVRTMTFDRDATAIGAPATATTTRVSASTSGRTEQRKRGHEHRQPRGGGGRAKSRARAATQQREHTTTSVYVTGLPDDTDELEVRDVFSKCGIIKSAGDADGGSEAYKIKLYRDSSSGMLKGDALVTYLKRPSVELAIQILDGTPLRDGSMPMAVTEATFTPRDAKSMGEDGMKLRKPGDSGNSGDGGSQPQSKKQRALAVRKEQQLLGWDGFDDDYLKSEVTVILKHLFDMSAVIEEYASSRTSLSQTEFVDTFVRELEEDVRMEINDKLRSSLGDGAGDTIDAVRELRVFKRSADGVVSVEFKTPTDAERCISLFDGRLFDGRRIAAHKWDGHTNFNAKRVETTEDMELRLQKFADDLEND